MSFTAPRFVAPRTRPPRHLMTAALSVLLLAGSAAADSPQPRLARVVPPGVRAGSAVEVAVGGTDLAAADVALIFSHPGLSAERLAPEGRFRVTAAADVPPDGYTVWVSNRHGVSNSRSFTVGLLPEVNEREPNNDVPEAQRIDLETTVNGTISKPTDVDYVVFSGKAGQRVLAHAAAGSIDSKARPLVELFSADGRRLAANHNSQDTDALADAVLPADGDYLVRVSEFAHTGGGPDHFYRLTLTAGPWLDAVFPPVITRDKPTAVTLLGRNLPEEMRNAELGVRNEKPDPAGPFVPSAFRPVRFPYPEDFSLRIPHSAFRISATDLPVVSETDAPNDTPATAQDIPVPCEVAGRIGTRHDRDCFRFPAKKGDVVGIQLLAERIGSPIDAFLSIRTTADQDTGGGDRDDDPADLHPIRFPLRSLDPAGFLFTAPVDGPFVVAVGSRDSGVVFGPRCLYRLRVGRPAPDFRAVVVPRAGSQPGGLTVRAGGQAVLDVFVHRLDGFDGPVTATATDLPPGVTATPALVGRGQTWGTLVLTAGPDAKPGTGPILVQCTAAADGKPLTRPARPGNGVWAGPDGGPWVRRLDPQLLLAVRPGDGPGLGLAADWGASKPGLPFVRPGDRVAVPVRVTAGGPVTLALEPTRPPPGVAPVGLAPETPAPLPAGPGTVTLVVAPTAPPGRYAVVLRADGPGGATAHAAPAEVEVLPLALARVSLQPGPAPLRPGGTATVLVRVERFHGYSGPFAVTLSLPAGLSAGPATLPAGADEVSVPVAAAAALGPGPAGPVVVTLTGTVHDKFPVAQDARLTLDVGK